MKILCRVFILEYFVKCSIFVSCSRVHLTPITVSFVKPPVFFGNLKFSLLW